MANFLIVKNLKNSQQELENCAFRYKKMFPAEWNKYLTIIVSARNKINIQKLGLANSNLVELATIEEDYSEIDYITRTYPSNIFMNFLFIPGIEELVKNV